MVRELYQRLREYFNNLPEPTEGGAVTAYTADVDHFSAYAIENKVYSKISNEKIGRAHV